MKKLVIFAFALLVCLTAGAQKNSTKKSSTQSAAPKATTTQTAPAAQSAPKPSAQPVTVSSTPAAAPKSVSSSKHFAPKAGDFSFGVAWNPISQFGSYQPETNAFAGSFVKSLGDYPHQMFFLGIDPKFSFVFRYHFSDNWGLRGTLGLSGSTINYKEYVMDDVAYKADTYTQARVEDCIHSDMKGISLGLEAEYTKSFGPLAFIAGFGAQFAIGGGKMTFDYGNTYGSHNSYAPHTMPYLMLSTNDVQTLNEYGYIKNGATGGQMKNVSSARPLERYNIGMCKALALTCNMGIEYFFIGQMSITLAVTFVPVAIYFQPETYTSFEGYCTTGSGSVISWDTVVSPGSNALLYGTQNVGIRLGFNYYL